ncbi:MAG: peptidyl-prolyl cis-trans isomerase [Candidatus Dependentiae bacterium]|nr:peptidyl-prolyl cis-trans isomerase [Candidatus Dependentiae bacterium]
MITVLRGMLKSHVYRIFLWIFLAVLIFGGISFDFSDNRPWVIKVYKEKSTELDFRQALAASQRQYDYLKAQGLVWPRKESIEKEVLRRMVSDSLVQNVGHDLDLVVPEILLQEQLASQLSSLPAYFFDSYGQLNINMLEKVIAPRSFDSFIQEMENEIKSNLLFGLITIGSYVPKFEVEMQYIEEYANKKYSILKFSLDKALDKAKEKEVSDEVLERFYKKSEHGDTYKSAEKRAGTYWKFNCKNYGITVSKSEISTYYDEHKKTEFLETAAQVQVRRIFFVPSEDGSFDARSQAQIVREELMQDPKTFAAVAKKIAAAKLPSQGSEKTGFFAKDTTEYDKTLVDTAFEQLAQDGDISEVIKTEKGYEILQRVSRKPAKYKSLESEEATIKEKLLQEKFAKRFKQDAERLVANASYNKESLANFIEKKKGHKETLSLESKKINLFSIKLFETEQGQYAIFMCDKEEWALLHCTEVQKRTLKPFEEIKSSIRADYYKKQAQLELESIALDVMKQSDSMSFKELAHKYDAHLETAESTYENDKMEHSAILRNPEVMQKIKVLQSAGAMIDVITATESYLIRLDEVAPIDEKMFEEKKSTITASLASKAKYKGKDSFIASLYRHAKLNNKIEIKDQLIKDTKDTSL